jgi:hypothetical protein
MFVAFFDATKLDEPDEMVKCRIVIAYKEKLYRMRKAVNNSGMVR